jgi:hypothetical protein
MAFWALKTGQTKGGEEVLPEDYWEQFLEKRIIAIGWGEIDISPEAGKEEIREALKTGYNYGDRQAIPAALTIFNFNHLNLRDKILLCRGDSFSFGKNIRLYGVAKITGPATKGYLGKWPVFQHNTDIEEFPEERREIRKDELTGMLRKGLLHGKLHGGSLFLTLQEITREGYESVVSWATRQPL